MSLDIEFLRNQEKINSLNGNIKGIKDSIQLLNEQYQNGDFSSSTYQSKARNLSKGINGLQNEVVILQSDNNFIISTLGYNPSEKFNESLIPINDGNFEIQCFTTPCEQQNQEMEITIPEQEIIINDNEKKSNVGIALAAVGMVFLL